MGVGDTASLRLIFAGCASPGIFERGTSRRAASYIPGTSELLMSRRAASSTLKMFAEMASSMAKLGLESPEAVSREDEVGGIPLSSSLCILVGCGSAARQHCAASPATTRRSRIVKCCNGLTRKGKRLRPRIQASSRIEHENATRVDIKQFIMGVASAVMQFQCSNHLGSNTFCQLQLELFPGPCGKVTC